MARRRYDDGGRAWIEAQLEAMQRARKARAAHDAKALANFAQLPEWIKPGIECVETGSGCEFRLERIDPTRPDGLIFVVTNRDAPPDYTYDDEIADFVERVTRGLVIVRGYTPAELAGGFRHSSMGYEEYEIVWHDEPPQYGTDARVEAEYNKLKPKFT